MRSQSIRRDHRGGNTPEIALFEYREDVGIISALVGQNWRVTLTAEAKLACAVIGFMPFLLCA
jgi:hypothetical protein